MTADNRTNEPTEAQVEAAAKAMIAQNPDYERFPPTEEEREWYRRDARAALVAAQGAAPQAEGGSRSRVIDLAEKWADEKLGGYIARTSFMQGVRFALEVTAAPVLPSSTVDEDALAEVLTDHVLMEPNGGTSSWSWCKCSCGFEVSREGVTRDYVEKLARKHQARAVVEAIGGEIR